MACGFSSKNTLKKVYGCIPLALFALIFVCFEIAFASYQIASLRKSEQWGSAAAYIATAVSSLQLIFSAIGLFSILAKWAKGIKFIYIVAKMLLFAHLIGFISTLVQYIANLTGHWTDDGKKWEPSNEEWTMIVIVIAFNVLILLNFWIILSCFASLQMVVAAGGTGFEMQNYKEIKAGRNVKSGESSALTEDESV